MHIKILLVEDQKLMRIGIQSLFCDYPDLEIIGEATNGKDAWRCGGQGRFGPRASFP